MNTKTFRENYKKKLLEQEGNCEGNCGLYVWNGP